MKRAKPEIPVGTMALILSKLYYGVVSKSLENLEIERYFSILHFLHGNNGCSQQHICNNLSVDKTAMVKVIDYLIKAGLVERQVNPEDRREHFIMLTKKGSRQTEEIVAAFQMVDREMFSHVSREDKENFLKVMATITSNLRELPSNDLFFNYIKTKKK